MVGHQDEATGRMVRTVHGEAREVVVGEGVKLGGCGKDTIKPFHGQPPALIRPSV